MSKPKTVPVPNPDTDTQVEQANAHRSEPQEPLSGSKKTKQQNHSRHNNGEG